jgi:hypothetical protein
VNLDLQLNLTSGVIVICVTYDIGASFVKGEATIMDRLIAELGFSRKVGGQRSDSSNTFRPRRKAPSNRAIAG